MTTWPSGLRRVTRNHFSSGGVGSNPAVVVFYFLPWLFFFISSLFLILFFFFSFLLIYLFFPFKKMVTPRFELGSREPESHMLPLHHATFISSLFSLYIFFTILYFFLFFLYKKTPPVGLEPTTLRLKAARSTDWARKALTIPFFSYYSMFFSLLLLLLLLSLMFIYLWWQRGRVV